MMFDDLSWESFLIGGNVMQRVVSHMIEHALIGGNVMQRVVSHMIEHARIGGMSGQTSLNST